MAGSQTVFEVFVECTAMVSLYGLHSVIAAQTVSVVGVAGTRVYCDGVQPVTGLQAGSVMVAKMVVFGQGVASGGVQFTGVGQTSAAEMLPKKTPGPSSAHSAQLYQSVFEQHNAGCDWYSSESQGVWGRQVPGVGNDGSADGKVSMYSKASQ